MAAARRGAAPRPDRAGGAGGRAHLRAAARRGADRRRARQPRRARAAAGPGLRGRPARLPARPRARRCPSTRGWAGRAGGAARLRRPRRRRRAAPAAAPRSPMPPAEGDTALVVHTSGTTAAPRPVELSFGNVQANALGSAVALGLDPDERWLCPLPLSHVGGLMVLLRSAIYGTRAVLDGAERAARRRHHASSRSCRPSCGGCSTRARARARGCASCCWAAPPPRPTCSSARPRRRLARRADLRPHPGLLAGRRATAARCPALAISLAARRRDPRRGPDRRRRRRPAHGRPRRASTRPGACA